MKKKFVVTAFAAAMVLVASAQTDPPKAPKSPKAPTEKIKDVPPPPPPPDEPPPPPPPPAPPEETIAAADEYHEFLKRNPSVKSLHWTNEEVIIDLKSSKKEHYNLTDEKSIRDAEVKYGKLPVAPPPPPPPPPAPRKSKGTRA